VAAESYIEFEQILIKLGQPLNAIGELKLPANGPLITVI
jgi:hypothetical protein